MIDEWNPFEEAKAAPESIRIFGVEVRVGDRVTYGDYNSEVFIMDENKVQELCDAVQMNYEPDPEGIRVVRVQDVRGFEREVPNMDKSYADNASNSVDMTSWGGQP